MAHLTREQAEEVRERYAAALRAVHLNPADLGRSWGAPWEVGSELKRHGLPTIHSLAREYDTSICTISDILHGKRHTGEQSRRGQTHPYYSAAFKAEAVALASQVRRRGDLNRLADSLGVTRTSLWSWRKAAGQQEVA